ncbi:MAG: redoxin domain-containing protein [Solirubrobacterales bacterium]|nr:redoxin domain-containing protein [Solirubrobacterales bacterium]
MHRARVRAPELRGAGGWIGVDDLALADLRGRVVLLHFWTLACINCLRVVEELRGLERRFAGELVVVSVHSPKFPHEHDHEAVRAAVGRHRIEHPVLDDPDMRTWDAYAVRAWPTVVLVDAEGRVALTISGEGHAVGLARAVEQLVAEAGDEIARGPLEVREPPPPAGELAFPGKVAASPEGDRLAIADTGHDRVLVCTPGGEVLEEVGGLYQPQGVRFDGDGLLVCETGADRVWRIAGGERELLLDGIASPWDVVRWRGLVVVAEAGRHRLWVVDADGEPQVLAGTGAEGLVDGPALAAALPGDPLLPGAQPALFAQPSGLAVAGEDLVLVDAEASALRVLRGATMQVETLVGHGLFAWGDADGDRERAALQHPLGVAAGADGALFVADTFNGLLRVWRGTHLWTVPVEGFAEPGGLDVLPGGRLVVADTGNHRVVVVDPEAAVAVALDVGSAAVTADTVVAEAGATLPLVLDLDLEGDLLDGPDAVRVTASASDPELLRGATTFARDALPAEVELELGAGSGRIVVEVRAATCDERACRVRRTQHAYDVVLT